MWINVSLFSHLLCLSNTSYYFHVFSLWGAALLPPCAPCSLRAESGTQLSFLTSIISPLNLLLIYMYICSHYTQGLPLNRTNTSWKLDASNPYCNDRRVPEGAIACHCRADMTTTVTRSKPSCDSCHVPIGGVACSCHEAHVKTLSRASLPAWHCHVLNVTVQDTECCNRCLSSCSKWTQTEALESKEPTRIDSFPDRQMTQ